MAKTKVSILTCVSNWRGSGPGHTALVIGPTVYSFENAGDWFAVTERSGWQVFGVKSYLKDNEHRPVILQELTSRVDAGKAFGYIVRSMAGDDDYIGSGVCSSQVSNAIDAAWNGSFNPAGVDTPHKVYTLANRSGIVADISWTWPGRDALPAKMRDDLMVRMRTEYPEVFRKATGGVVEKWGDDVVTYGFAMA